MSFRNQEEARESAKVPMAIFVYNRPQHTRRLFESLDKNKRITDVRPWIFSDAPKRPEHAQLVEETRNVAREWAAKHLGTFVERPSNFGVGRSLTGGLTDILAYHSQVIVLEDDLVVSSDFLDFVLEGLERYANNPRVMQISGHLHTGRSDNAYTGLFLPLSTSWGWATWARAWKLYKGSREIDVDDLQDDEFRGRFNVQGGCPFYEKLLEDCIHSPGEVWDIFWWYAIAKADGLVLHPNRSLVWNGGFDGTGVHCGTADDVDAPEWVYSNRPRLEPLIWPQTIEADERTFCEVKECLALMYGTAGLKERLLARLKRAADKLVGDRTSWFKLK